jgi:hypothetical protein
MQPPHCGRSPQQRKTAPGVTTRNSSPFIKRQTASLMWREVMTLHWQTIMEP